VIKRHRRLAII